MVVVAAVVVISRVVPTASSLAVSVAVAVAVVHFTVAWTVEELIDCLASLDTKSPAGTGSPFCSGDTGSNGLCSCLFLCLVSPLKSLAKPDEEEESTVVADDDDEEEEDEEEGDDEGLGEECWLLSQIASPSLVTIDWW